MTVKLNETALSVLLDSEAGPVGMDILRRGTNIFNQVQINAFQNFHIQSGNLLASIAMQPLPTPQGLTVVVGCKRIEGLDDEDQYAVFLEHGTQPHSIDAVNARVLESDDNNPNPLSPAFARKDPRHVNHPGFEARPFVRPALEAGRL